MKNVIEDRGTHSVIIIKWKKNFVKEVKFDTADLAIVESQKWHVAHENRSKNGETFYCQGTKGTQCLHTLINKTPKGMVTRHIDHDGLNNTRENLATSTHRDNVRDNRSAGISWLKPLLYLTVLYDAGVLHTATGIAVVTPIQPKT